MSGVVRDHTAVAGDWIMYRESGGVEVVRRFKALVLRKRTIISHWDEEARRFTILSDSRDPRWPEWYGKSRIRARNNPHREGLELLVWLPHYKEFAVVEATSPSGAGVLSSLPTGELVGFRADMRFGAVTVYVPMTEALDLPFNMDLPGKMNDLIDNFAAGLAV